MRTEAQRAVGRTRRSLNVIAILSGGLLWLSPVAVVAGILILLLVASGRMPPGGPALAAWGIASALAFCGGALAALRHRFDDLAAAAWLDERLGTRELLSAALSLSKPGRRAGRFDEELAERAEAVAPAARHPGWPLGALFRRALPALAACLALPAILAWTDPAALGDAFRAGVGGGAGGRLETASRRRPSAQRDGAAALASGADAAAVARFLFADDPARADAAERALREGRTEEFRNLLERAVKDLDNHLSRAVSDSERARLLEERQKLDEALAAIGENTPTESSSGGSLADRSLPGSDRADAEGGSAKRAPGEGDSVGDASSRSAPRRRASENDAVQGKEGGGKGGSERDAPGDGSGGKGSAPSPVPAPGGGGTPGGESPGAGGSDRAGNVPGAAGNGPGGWSDGGGERTGDAGAAGGTGTSRTRGPVSPSATGGILTVAPDREAPFFDFVLRGSDPGDALPRLFAQAARAAEAPIVNSGLPLEYEDFLRSYFLALQRQLQESGAAQGASPATKGAP